MMRLILLAVALIGAPLFAATSPAQHRPVHRPVHRVAPAAPRAIDWLKTFAATPEGGVRMGNPAAKVKLIEYGSRLCPYCGHFHAESMATLRANYVASGKVSYEFRDYPVHGALDLPGILIGHCVSTVKFFPLLDEMMAAQPQILSHEEEAVQAAQQQGLDKAPPTKLATVFAEKLGLIDFMAKRGMPAARTRACLADKAGFAALARRYDDANRVYNVRSTPTFIINGTVVAGVNDWAGLEPALKAAGA
jgi:protein-disulfide isomerase